MEYGEEITFLESPSFHPLLKIYFIASIYIYIKKANFAKIILALFIYVIIYYMYISMTDEK